MSEFNSRIILGDILHARSDPIAHAFSYPVVSFLFDLDELPRLAARFRGFFGFNTWAPISLYDRDYLDQASTSIRVRLKELLLSRGCTVELGKVLLLTSARCFGYAFNPVSFYYCFDTSHTLRYHVAEVNNTYGERHCYVLGGPDAVAQVESNGKCRYQVRKEFFVSPFNEVLGDYEFVFSPLEQKLDILMNLHKPGERPFIARMRGELLEWRSSNLVRALLRMPRDIALTMWRIVWQAQKLRWIKKLKMLDPPVPSSPHTKTVRAMPFLQAIPRWGRLKSK